MSEEEKYYRDVAKVLVGIVKITWWSALSVVLVHFAAKFW